MRNCILVSWPFRRNYCTALVSCPSSCHYQQFPQHRHLWGGAVLQRTKLSAWHWLVTMETPSMPHVLCFICKASLTHITLTEIFGLHVSYIFIFLWVYCALESMTIVINAHILGKVLDLSLKSNSMPLLNQSNQTCAFAWQTKQWSNNFRKLLLKERSIFFWFGPPSTCIQTTDNASK